ncbi:hypothetical protein CSV79_16335 [Sporosarcina sp. P13]|uniref:hypothetical protein n=1 Tax=Sporosarcina sp. P13 TaxID=2048263 RepID=UPI000C166C4F|nr:hypothetical protein [Sporosarcina sp. P13]PIC62576.1 hypothetical protein CSV79_16335 [Sporosarcina sp. P13]
MRKLLIVLSLLFIIGFISILLFNTKKQPQETPKVVSKLQDNGFVDGKREFIFSVENVDKKEIEFRFLTALEYNFSLEYLTYQDLDTFNGTTEHMDLKEENEEARKVLLKPNERIEYRLHLSGYHTGDYEMTISPSVYEYDFGLQRIEFSIE